MKKFLLFLCGIFLCAVCNSETLDISWYVGDNLYTTTQCNSGGDLILPTPPTSKPGYNFVGWRNNFQLVEYLESTGTQYIDTGIVPSGGTKIEVYATLLENANKYSSLAGTVVACHYDTYNYTYFSPLYISTDGRLYYYFNSHNYTGYSYGINDNVRAVLSVNSDNTEATVEYRNVSKNITKTFTKTGSITTDLSIYMFANSHCTRGAIEQIKARIFYAKIWNNNTLVRDFVPVIDAAGVPCMWDKVSETFFYNAGTGNFIAGPVVEE